MEAVTAIAYSKVALVLWSGHYVVFGVQPRVVGRGCPVAAHPWLPKSFLRFHIQVLALSGRLFVPILENSQFPSSQFPDLLLYSSCHPVSCLVWTTNTIPQDGKRKSSGSSFFFVVSKFNYTLSFSCMTAVTMNHFILNLPEKSDKKA